MPKLKRKPDAAGPAGVEPTPYAVGYGKPPLASRFVPGRSGNPHGRPQGSRNRPPRIPDERLKDIIKAEAYRTITVNDAGRPLTMTMAEAVMRSVAVGAAKGQARAQKLFTQLLGEVERSDKAEREALLNEAIAYTRDCMDELAHCKARGIKAPDFLPHPADILIDLHQGTVHFVGPITPEDKQAWEAMRQRIATNERSIADLKVLLAAETDATLRQSMQDQIAEVTKSNARLAASLARLRH